VAARGETLFLRDVEEACAYVRTESGEPWQPRRGRYLAPSCVCIPLKVSGRVVGVLNVNDKDGGDFTAGDVELLQLFANQAALAVGNAIAHRELRRLSVTDGLTRTYLPTYFRKRLGEVAAAARMHESTLAVVMIDLDAFKGVNDRHGHQVGDAVLEGVAAVLRSSVRPHDIVARYGGEEFVVVLVGVTPAIALAITERQRDAIASSRFTDGVADVRITASFGVAMLPYDAGDPGMLVSVADRNLYASKHVGGNAITFSSAVRGMMVEEGPRSEV
jgi:diguanylate cyclase (GGDEF)-like protein